MCKILFKVPCLGLSITSDTRWIDSRKTLLTQMSDRHISNCIAWLNKKIKEVNAFGYDDSRKVFSGFTLKEWKYILIGEQKRRLIKESQSFQLPEKPIKNNTGYTVDCYGSNNCDLAMDSFIEHNYY